MNIVIINECKRYGGCEIYVNNISKILREAGHNVNCVYLNTSGELLSDDEYDLKLDTSNISKIISNKGKINDIKYLLDSLSPDVIIVNNIFSEVRTVYKAIKNYNVLQVLHDYSVVCPKSSCITDSMDVCKGYKHEVCLKRCSYHNTKVFLFIKLMLMRSIDAVRKNKKTKFISPSRKLAQYAISNGYPAIVLPNPININIIEKREFPHKHKYVYIGALNENKGIYDMLPAFSKFANNRNVSLHIYGNFTTKKDKLFLKKYISSQIIYHGFLDNMKIMSALKDAYGLLVPSLWMENYPTTVLEGFANNVLVIGSDRGGIPELLEQGRGITFKYGEEGLIKALEYADDLSVEAYESIVAKATKYVQKNNLPQIYVKRLMEIINYKGYIDEKT